MSNATIHEGHLLQNAAASSTRRMSALEERLFQTSAHLAAIPDVRFFIATADLFSDLYYAPASDFALPCLESLVEAQQGGVVGAIRNRFMAWSRQGFLSDLSHVLRANIDEGALLCVELSENGEFGKSHIHFAGALGDTPAPVQEILDRESMRPYPDALRMLRHELPESATMHFILRPDWRPDWQATNIPSRRIDLVQVGFVFGPTSVSDLPLDVIDHLCTMSGFATLVLLTERERYFDKAIRQAARGSLVKIAPADQLKPQVEFLKRLHDSNVPAVLDSDLGATVGWFRMSKLTLPSMADLLCSTRGFQEFEVDALVRASFRHLEDTYWRGLKVNKDVPTHCAVQVAIALALDQAVTAAHTLTQLHERLTSNPGKPVLFEHERRVLPPGDLRRFQEHIAVFATGASRRQLRFSWESFTSSVELRDPVEFLKALADAVKNLPEDQRAAGLFIPNNDLHGDAHFGNLLIDGSVPEDPLVVSIDQASPVPHWDKLCDFFQNCCGPVEKNAFHAEAARLKADPAYDIAKLMLSTSCAYDIVLRRGLRLGAARTGAIRIVRSGEDRLTRFDATGGISASNLCSVEPPVCVDALGYYSQAVRTILREHGQKYLRVKCGEESLNLALVRLWLLTIRHAFSVAAKLLGFGDDLDRAVVMYAMAWRFLSVGAGTVEQVLRSGLTDDPGEIANALFGWREAEDKWDEKADPLSGTKRSNSKTLLVEL